MATLFSDGFESGDTSLWTVKFTDGTNQFNVVTTQPHHGNYSGQIITNSTTFSYVRKALVTNPGTAYARFYVWFDSLPTGGDIIEIGELDGTAIGNDVIAVKLHEVGGNVYWSMYWWDGGAQSNEDGLIPIQTGRWYCVEIYDKINNGAGESKLYIDGVLTISKTALNNTNYGNTHSQFILGTSTVSLTSPFTYYVDCAVVADAYIGPETDVVPTRRLTPTGTLTRTRLIENYLNSLILYYPFHEGVGAFAEDLSPFKRHGTLVGTASWITTAPLLKGIHFADSQITDVGYVIIPSFAFVSATNTLTFVGWINSKSVGFDEVAVIFSDDNWGLFPVADQIAFYRDWLNPDTNTLSFQTKEELVQDLTFFSGYEQKWFHFAFVIDFTNATIKTYRDGILHANLAGTPPWTFPSSNIAKRLGDSAGYNQFLGDMDEFRIFNRALTPTEIFEEYYKAARMSY